MDDITKSMNQITSLSEIDENVIKSSDCSFLYFHKQLYSTFLNYIYAKTEHRESVQMQLVMNAFSDAGKLLRNASYFDPEYYMQKYREFLIEKSFYRCFLVPLCTEIETVLRVLLFGRNIDEMKPVNPKEQKFGQYRKYVELPPLQICGVTVYMKRLVERYLERSFYNFSTLHDSRTYAEMAILGREIFGLSLIKNNLPRENAQAVDLSEILNVDRFLRKYNYNMVQQNFVERKTNEGSKYLKTIGIETMSLSFQRHGLGISKNLMQQAYHSVLGNFEDLVNIFANNLFRSLLSKESRWYSQSNSVGYTFDRAMTLRREMSKLGKEGDIKTSYSVTEKCIELVSAIGNALGLVRLVRSGKMYSINQSRKYFTSLSTTSQDEDDEDDVLYAMVSNLKEISGIETNNIDGTCLQNFFILFPVLSLAWLDTSMRGKDMLNKKFQTFDAYYTDDGFSLGSAFIFEVINQSASFDRLNWFEASSVAFAKNRKEIIESFRKGSVDVNAANEKTSLFGLKQPNENVSNSSTVGNEQSRLRVLIKRLEMKRKEMDLLQYSVLGARVFFTSPTQR
jgi:WASH complex subunit 7